MRKVTLTRQDRERWQRRCDRRDELVAGSFVTVFLIFVEVFAISVHFNLRETQFQYAATNVLHVASALLLADLWLLLLAILRFAGCTDYVDEQMATMKASEARWRGTNLTD